MKLGVIITVVPVAAVGLRKKYAVLLESGRVLVSHTTEPVQEAARRILASGVKPETPLVIQERGTSKTTTVGAAAPAGNTP